MLVGIDPSFSSTGVAVLDDSGCLKEYKGFKCSGKCYTELGSANLAAKVIANGVLDFIGKECQDIVIEVPAPSQSGFYLSVLHGWLVCTLSRYHRVHFVSCLACDSFIKNKTHSKSYIVKFCKDNGWVPNIRINNDICTAVVLAKILLSFKKGEYKNTLTEFEYEKNSSC